MYLVQNLSHSQNLSQPKFILYKIYHAVKIYLRQNYLGQNLSHSQNLSQTKSISQSKNVNYQKVFVIHAIILIICRQ